MTAALESLWDNGEEKAKGYNSEPLLNVFKRSIGSLQKNKVIDTNMPNELGKELLSNDQLRMPVDVADAQDRNNDYNSMEATYKLNGPFAYEGELRKRGRLSGKIMGSHAKWTLRYFVLKGDYLYEFRDKEHFQTTLKENGGTIDHNRNEKLKAFSLQGYEVLVDIRNQLHCLILNPLPGQVDLPLRCYRPNRGRFTRLGKAFSEWDTSTGGEDGSIFDKEFLLFFISSSFFFNFII